jgi:hypothetical protein
LRETEEQAAALDAEAVDTARGADISRPKGFGSAQDPAGVFELVEEKVDGATADNGAAALDDVEAGALTEGVEDAESVELFAGHRRVARAGAC